MKTTRLIRPYMIKRICKKAKFFNKIIAIKSALVCFLFVTAITIGTSTDVWALERPTAEQIEQYKIEGTLAKRIEVVKALGNHLPSQSFVEKSNYKLRKLALKLQGYTQSEIDERLAPPPAWKGMPTTGTVRVLTLLIEFPEYTHTNLKSSIDSKIYGGGSGGFPYESLHNYYDRSSYSQLNIQGNVLGWYPTAYPRSNIVNYYGPNSVETLVKEVLTYYDGLGHDFTQYDNDNDGKIDYLVIIWTGPDTGWGSLWWGFMWYFHDQTFTIDGKTLDTYSWQWESRPWPGTFSPLVAIHETGHALGLPDLYDYDGNVGPDGGVGGLDMMDNNWGDHNCFSKFVLDWTTPTMINSGSHTVTLSGSGSSQDAVLVMPGISSGDQFEEFFMVQNRYRTNNDNTYPIYPNDGLLIWHIDARLDGTGDNYLYDNSYTDHKLVRLMEADGLEEIEQNGWADAGDYYTEGDTFGPSTFPNSNSYGGSSTGITVENISASGTVMTADISTSGSSGSENLLFNSVTPCRIVDTRISKGGTGPIPSGTQRNFIATGLCGVPHGPAKAAMVNITAVNATGSGYLTVFAYPESRPTISILNYGLIPGFPAIANGVIVPICDTAINTCPYDFSIYAYSTTDVVVDVMGYFAKP